MICSTGTYRVPSLNAMSRGNTLGTFTRAKRRSPVSGSDTMAARLSARLEMYGNGWAGSTASGVSTGKIRRSNTSVNSIRSATSRSCHPSTFTPTSARAGTRVDRQSCSWRATITDTASPTTASCSAGVRPSAERTVRPTARWSFSAATRT